MAIASTWQAVRRVPPHSEIMKYLKKGSIFHVSDHGLEVVCHYAMLCRSDYQFPAICLDLCALKLPRSRHYFEATIWVDFQTILSHWWLDRSEVKDRKKKTEAISSELSVYVVQ